MKLRTKLVVFFFLVVIIPLILTQLYLTIEMRNSLEEISLDNLENLAVLKGREIENLIESGKENIILLSHNPILQSENYTIYEKLYQLKIVQNYHKIFDDLTLIDTQGHTVLSTTYNYIGEWETNLWYKKALNGSVVISDATVILNPWKLVLIYFSPVFSNNGSIIGVLSGQIDFKKFWEILDNYTIGKTGFLYLIDSTGRILSHPNKDLIFAKVPYDQLMYTIKNNLSGTTSYINGDNINMVCGYSSILHNTYNDTRFWSVIAVQPFDEIFSSIIIIRNQITFFIILMGIILITAGVVFSHRTTKPIQQLTYATEKIANGDLKHHVDIESGDELEQLGRSFNKMVDDLRRSHEIILKRSKEIETLLQEKEAFIHQLGHDLKTPLTPLLTLLPIIRKRVNDPKTIELLDTLIQSSHYMKNLIIRILQLAKLNAPSTKFHFEEASLLDEINKVLKRHELLLKKHNIEVKNLVDKDIVVSIDRLHFGEVIDNLISNAIKYSPNGGEINITAEKKDDEVKVSIRDTGIGMTEEQIRRIFDEFYKADESRHDFESSGIGLSICRKIIEKHGGKIWAESPGLGKGSTFYFTLKTAKPMDDGL